MANTPSGPSRVDVRRTEPSRDVKRLVIYFVGLLAVYIAGVMLLQPTAANGFSQNWAIVLMAAPTVGALLARFLGPAVIQWGRPSVALVVCLLASMLPLVFGYAGYRLTAAAGLINVDDAALSLALGGAAGAVAMASVTALGEEIGWRGFLWPLVRRRMTFIPASLVITAIWWAYHVPVILLGWYGNLGGLPAFTVAIIGFAAFVGVLTDRSRSLWPSVLAHGAWNGLIATSFAHSFTGNSVLLGEFGWVAAISMLVLGAIATIWHVATGGGKRMPYPSRFGSNWTAR